MTRILIAALLLSVLAGCAELALDLGLGPNRSEMSSKVQAVFDKRKDELESKAKAGQITWVQAMQGEKEADRKLASDEFVRSYSNWKFDSDDEEYYAYCIALAERLDNVQITYAQFNAAHTQRFNQIRARTSDMYLKQQAVRNSQPRSTSCTTRNVGTTDHPQYQTDCY